MRARFFILSFVVSLACFLALAPGGAPTRAAQPGPAAPQGKSIVHTENAGRFAGGAGSQMRAGDSYSPLGPSAPCEVSGLINTDTTWSPNLCDPYIVVHSVDIQPGTTLTIQPGTTVKFASLQMLAVAGTLAARGTATNPITFTSNQPSPETGDWGYIYFSGSSVDAAFDGGGNYTGGSIIQYAVIEYAGGASVSNNGALRIEASAPFIDHNTIKDNQGNGIYIWSNGASRIRGNTITRNSGAGVHVYSSSPTIQGNTITDNSNSGIYIHCFSSGSPIILGNTITGNSASQGGGIDIIYGTVIVSSNIITGNSASRGGGIYLYGTSPTIQGNTIANNTAAENNRGGGIYLAYNSRPTINDNNLYGNMTGNPATIPNDLYNGNIFGGAAVSATNSYWGTTDPAVIEDHIWHFPDSVEPLLGSVAYIPYRTSPVPPCTPAPAIEVFISGPTTGITNTAYTFTATVVPLTAVRPITYAWQATGQSALTHVGGLSDTAVFTWSMLGAQVITVTATNAEGTVTDIHAIAIGRPVPVESVAVDGPTIGIVGAPYTFSASASPLTTTQPITYAWQATGQSPVPPHVDSSSDTVTFTWPTTGTKVITVTASNAWGSARASHTIAISLPDADGDAYEPDGTCAQASLLKVDGTVQQHTFHQQADQDWARFTAVSGITYVLQAVSTGTGADLVLELYDVCDGNLLDSDDDAFGADARLIFAAPSTGTYYVKALNHKPATYGPHVTYELSVRVSPSDAVVLIVAGHDDHYRLQSNILTCTNATFLTFLRGGLARTNLRYLSDIDDDAQTDADGDGVSDVDGDSTSANVQDAITNWAASLTGADIPFFLYLADHGGIDAFLTDGSGDTITPDELDGWLDALEDEGVPVNVVYEACHSGSFIDGLKKQRRVVIASTGRLNNAYPSRRGALFSDAFFTQLGQCKDLYTSFRAATAAVGATGLWQTPWLDDNGDGMPDDKDGAVARQRGLPICGFVDRPPVIDRVTPPASIVDGDGVLGAQVRDDGGAKGLEVWAFVYPPSFKEPPPTGDGTMPDLEDLPKVLFSDTNGDGEYVGVYEDFIEDGAYHVVVYAQDAAGNHALPAVMTVRTKWWAYLPAVVRDN